MNPALMSNFLVIPGIGGHPRFHNYLIKELEKNHTVHSAPHGDFHADPYESMDDHVYYWEQIALRAMTPAVCVIGISFGAHIAILLAKRRSINMKRLILISPWAPTAFGRFSLSIFGKFPKRITANILSRFLMYWSNKNTESRKNLTALRKELYDSSDKVSARWLQRLLLIREGIRLNTLGDIKYIPDIFVIFGSNEILYAFQRPRFQRLAEVNSSISVHLLPGGHEIGTSSSIHMAGSIVRFASAPATINTHN